MSPLTDELKTQMTTEAQTKIEQLVEQVKQTEGATLSDIERLVRVTMQAMQAELTETLVQAQAGEEKAEERQCPTCGGRMRYKGHKEKQLVTTTGEVKLERAYYYCETCRQGIFPPG